MIVPHYDAILHALGTSRETSRVRPKYKSRYRS